MSEPITVYIDRSEPPKFDYAEGSNKRKPSHSRGSNRRNTHRMVSAREIVGKKIVRFDPGLAGISSNSGRPLHSEPRIYLDDGSFLYFMTEEPGEEGDMYGTFIGRGGVKR